MKTITAFCLPLIVFLIPCGLCAQDKIEPPVLEKQIQPEYPADLKLFLIEPAKVEIVIDQEGVPFSLKSATSLPDNVVEALSKWRFKPARKNGKAGGYALSYFVPIHRPIKDVIGRMSRWQRHPSKEINDAMAATKDLDAASAARLEAQLGSKPSDASARMALLAFARSNAVEIRQLRLRQILWLATNQPQNDILGAPFAIVTAPSSTEAAAYEQIRQVWLKQLAQNPADPAILEHATNFLRFSDPGIVENALQQQTDQTDGAAVFLGDLYGLAAIGTTAVETSGGLVSAASAELANSPFGVKARNALTQTSDLRVLFSAFHTVSQARLLIHEDQLPSGYADFCGRLLARAREAYPEFEGKCDAIPHPPSAGPSAMKIGGTVQAAKLIKMVRPDYPPQAKFRRITGTVIFHALIGEDGHIRNLELLSGPLALYKSARGAVLRWEYKPTTLNGVPVAVITALDVNYQLQ